MRSTFFRILCKLFILNILKKSYEEKIKGTNNITAKSGRAKKGE
jgi:hypothetical protein